MKTLSVVSACGLLLVLAGCNTTAATPPGSQTTPQGQAMEHMMADINTIRTFIYGGGTRAEANAAAVDLASWSQRMSELFPPGQASVDYVDMSPARVKAAPEAMQRTAELLLSAVQNAERATVGDRLAQTERDGCGACHLSNTR